ncbi:MAG: hypothetical protein ACXVPU_10980 [Bacteroidia bacterium]
MKQLFIILVITGILLQNFGNTSILIHYQLNKDYISKNLCENKNKPMMHCNGKCHLMKQLAEQSKKESNSPFQNLKEKFEVQYFSTVEPIRFNGFNKEIKPNSQYSFFIPKAALNSVFHPPQA